MPNKQHTPGDLARIALSAVGCNVNRVPSADDRRAAAHWVATQMLEEIGEYTVADTTLMVETIQLVTDNTVGFY